MSKEQRTFALSALTLFFLAFSNLLTTGKFIFTFPINDFVLLAVTIYFFVLNYSKTKIQHLLLIFFSISIFCSNYYNFEFFLNSEQMTDLTNSVFTDFALILSFIFYFALFFILLKKEKATFLWILFVINFVLIVFLQFYEQKFLLFLIYIFLPISIFISKKSNSTNYKSVYYLFLLVNVLHFTKVISIYF
jgi:hypothetical protein